MPLTHVVEKGDGNHSLTLFLDRRLTPTWLLVDQ